MACADGKLFVGQVFSEFVLAVDIDTQSIAKRIVIPGGGEGAIAASKTEAHIYFASNRTNRLFIIDSATYDYQEVHYPPGGRAACVFFRTRRNRCFMSVCSAVEILMARPMSVAINMGKRGFAYTHKPMDNARDRTAVFWAR